MTLFVNINISIMKSLILKIENIISIKIVVMKYSVIAKKIL